MTEANDTVMDAPTEAPETLKSFRAHERKYLRYLARMQKGMPALCGLPNLSPHLSFVYDNRRGDTAAALHTLACFSSFSRETFDALVKGEDPMHGPLLPIRNIFNVRKKIGNSMRLFEVAIIDVLPGGPDAPNQRVRHLVRDHKSDEERKIDMYNRTVDCVTDAQTLTTEERALKKIAEILDPTDYKRYMLTGTVHVFGKSGVIYIVRKGRPTIAYRKIENGSSVERRFIATLCLHPLGYYAASWVGALCPTDEAIAHILLIRGDEHLYWKRANHHSIDDLQGDF